MEASKAVSAQVVARVRPCAPGERNAITVGDTDVTLDGKVFSFNAAFGPACRTSDVHAAVGAPLVAQVLAGANASVLAYGQSGSGKTHTMMGTAAEPGLVPRAVEAVAAAVEAGTHSAVVTMVEVYNEKIRDLLAPDAGGGGGGNLQVSADPARGGAVVVRGAAAVPVAGRAAALAAVAAAARARAAAATGLNAASSRSHLVITLLVTGAATGRAAKLSLVDLAGSERAAKSGAAGAALAEGAAINTSLLCLERVVAKLADGGGGGVGAGVGGGNSATASNGSPGHLPYRDSKLTHMLQDCLGGAALTAVVVCCSPDAASAAETLSALRFGARARGLTTVLHAAAPPKAGDKALLAAARAELAAAREAAAAAKEHWLRCAAAAAALQLAGLAVHWAAERACA